ncbi:MAG: phosphoribulokinase [Chloroflexaceae bacterium]|nr:phosphoribulokinase [Chloroflexaceae bacterium]
MESRRPLMLGLVGDSASGKTTLVRGVVRILGHDGVTPICLDDYQRYSREERNARNLTDADPQANDLELMVEHLRMLRAGGQISKPVYDHRTGSLRDPELVAATGLIIAYGMLTLTPPNATDLFDLTIYLDPAESLRRAWRLERDVRERGYSPAEVVAREPARERDAARFIHRQRPLASTVLRVRPAATGPAGTLDTELIIRHGANAHPLDPICADLAAATYPALRIERDIVDEDGREGDRITIESTLTSATAARVADLVWSYLPGAIRVPLEQIGQTRAGSTAHHNPGLALVQLFIVGGLVRTRGL